MVEPMWGFSLMGMMNIQVPSKPNLQQGRQHVSLEPY